MKASTVLVISAALLPGCGGGGSDGGGGVADTSQVCPYIHGSGVTTAFTSTCPTCAISDQDLATDGVLETAATIAIPTASSGSVTLRATGTTQYQAMSNAGVVLGEAAAPGTSSTNDGVELRTYLAGAPAGTNQGASPTIVGGNQASPQVFEFNSAGPYDAVETGFTVAANTGPIYLKVYEFCAGDQ